MTECSWLDIKKIVLYGWPTTCQYLSVNSMTAESKWRNPLENPFPNLIRKLKLYPPFYYTIHHPNKIIWLWWWNLRGYCWYLISCSHIADWSIYFGIIWYSEYLPIHWQCYKYMDCHSDYDCLNIFEINNLYLMIENILLFSFSL